MVARSELGKKIEHLITDYSRSKSALEGNDDYKRWKEESILSSDDEYLRLVQDHIKSCAGLTELGMDVPQLEIPSTPTPELEPLVRGSHILLEATSHYQDTLISTTNTLHGKNWYQAHEELHKQGQHMPTLRQFVDFLKLLKSGKAFDGKGDKISSNNLEQIFKEIIEVRLPWRSEWLDAGFKVINGVLHINYDHQTIDGQLQPQTSESLQSYLEQSKKPGISLDDWLNNATHQGLPSTNIPKGRLWYWAPMRDNKSGVRFGAGSGGAILVCYGGPRGSSSSLGVRPCAKKF